MRRRYTHTDSIKPFRIRNRFSYSSHDETAELCSFGNDFNKVLSEDIDMEDINDELDYDNEEIFAEDIVITESSDDDDEEESIDELEDNNDDNYEEGESNSDDNDKESESNNDDDDEEESIDELEGNNDDNYEEGESNSDDNDEKGESNNDEDDEEESIDELEGNNDDNYEEGESSNDDNDEEMESNNDEEEVIHQIVEALDEDKIPSCDSEFAPYFNNYTTTALFCWMQKYNISTNAYEDLVNIIHTPQFEPNHVVKNI